MCNSSYSFIHCAFWGLVLAMKSVVFVADNYKNRTDNFYYVVTL